MASQEGDSERTVLVACEDLGADVVSAKSQCGQSSPPKFRRRSL